MRDRRTLAMLAVLVLLVALGAAYLFFHRDGDAGAWELPAAVVLLLLLVGVSAGASRGRRVVRDEEEIDPEDRRNG